MNIIQIYGYKIVTNMKKFITTIILFTILCCVFTSCTKQYMAKELGGTVTINLEPGKKLVEATWKENHLWYLVEDMDSDYVPKAKVFQESSSIGLLNGKVIFIETK